MSERLSLTESFHASNGDHIPEACLKMALLWHIYQYVWTLINVYLNVNGNNRKAGGDDDSGNGGDENDGQNPGVCLFVCCLLL